MLGVEMTSRKTQPVKGLADSVCVDFRKTQTVEDVFNNKNDKQGLTSYHWASEAWQTVNDDLKIRRRDSTKHGDMGGSIVMGVSLDRWMVYCHLNWMM